MDHDQRFKALLQLRLADLLALVLGTEQAALYDCSAVEWLQQEIFPDPPEGQRLSIDIAGKVTLLQAANAEQATTPEPWLVLVHAEVESSDSVAPLRRRIYDYRHELQRKYAIPVLSIGVYLNVALAGLGWDTYTEMYHGEEILRFRFPYIGLPGLDAFEYVNGSNVLGVALSALMRVDPDRQGELKAEALERVTTAAIPEYHRYLLAECVDAYLPLEEPQLSDFRQRLTTPKHEAAMKTGTTLRQEGLEKGREDLVIRVLKRKFDTLPPSVEEHVRSMAEDDLVELTLRIPTAQSLEDLGLVEPNAAQDTP